MDQGKKKGCQCQLEKEIKTTANKKIIKTDTLSAEDETNDEPCDAEIQTDYNKDSLLV